MPITITATESGKQIISGIPYKITLATNIPATIFYTLNGSTPTTSSLVYVEPIALPTNNAGVTFSYFATNGSESTAVVSKRYAPLQAPNRVQRAQVANAGHSHGTLGLAPFASETGTVLAVYGAPGGITVDSPNVASTLDGYDGTGTGTKVRPHDLPLEEYNIVHSESDRQNKRGRGIGTLPATAKIEIPIPEAPSTSSSTSEYFFNPRAMVIYQDSRDADLENPVSKLNRPFFSMVNPSHTDRGSIVAKTETASNVTGTFLRSHYNPRDNTITYYYRDRETNQWIISKEPWHPKNENIGALHKMVFSSREPGAAFVYRWYLWLDRKII